jgi:steroid delta-isomerase-like uncharacterized protein
VSVEANKTCVRRHFEELWNKGQLEKVGDFFSEDFMNFGEQYQDGHEIIRGVVNVWRHAFPDLRFTIDSMVAEDDVVMCEVSFEGTHRGEFPLIPPLQGPTLLPNGQAFCVKHIHRFRLKDGKIVEHFAVRDDLGMFQQLGHLATISGEEGS